MKIMKLVLHIGMGKTGTTAFQSFCDLNSKVFDKLGYVYAGREFQNLKFRHPWRGRVVKKGVNKEKLYAKLEFIEDVMSLPRYDGKKALIWSNEDFSMSHKPDELITIIDEFVKSSNVFDSWEVYLVLRRQDQWIESAYKQWGLKHKTCSGKRIETPSEFIDAHLHLVDYLGLVEKWAQSSANLHVCSYDAAIEQGGIERYLTERMKLNLPIDELSFPGRVNESMSNEGSVIVATYNSRFAEPNYPKELISLLDKNLVGQREEKKSCFVSYEDRLRLSRSCEINNRKIEDIYFSRKERFSRSPVERYPQFVPDYQKIVGDLAEILAKKRGGCFFSQWKDVFRRLLWGAIKR